MSQQVFILCGKGDKRMRLLSSRVTIALKHKRFHGFQVLQDRVKKW